MNSLLQGWTVPARPTQPRQPGRSETKLALVGEITVANAIPLFAAIRAAHGDTIKIEIDCGGGNALCALGLYELLIEHPYHVVADIVGAGARSGAALVAVGADHRRIAPGARFMLHRTRASLEDATAEVLRETLVDLDTVDGLSAAIFAAATGQTPEQVAAWEHKATTFRAHEAVAVGLAHEIALTLTEVL